MASAVLLSERPGSFSFGPDNSDLAGGGVAVQHPPYAFSDLFDARLRYAQDSCHVVGRSKRAIDFDWSLHRLVDYSPRV